MRAVWQLPARSSARGLCGVPDQAAEREPHARLHPQPRGIHVRGRVQRRVQLRSRRAGVSSLQSAAGTDRRILVRARPLLVEQRGLELPGASRELTSAPPRGWLGTSRPARRSRVATRSRSPSPRGTTLACVPWPTSGSRSTAPPSARRQTSPPGRAAGGQGPGALTPRRAGARRPAPSLHGAGFAPARGTTARRRSTVSARPLSAPARLSGRASGGRSSPPAA